MFLYYFKLTLFDLHEPPTLKEQIKKRHKPSCWTYVHSITNVGRPSPLFAFNIRGFFSFTGTPFLYDVFGLLRRRVIGGMLKSVLVSATFKGQCFALCQLLSSVTGTPARTNFEHTWRALFLKLVLLEARA